MFAGFGADDTALISKYSFVIHHANILMYRDINYLSMVFRHLGRNFRFEHRIL